MNYIVFEVGLALILIAAAALLSAKLRLSIVPFLILTGMAVGPHAPKIGFVDFRFIHSAPLIEFMGRLGVLFLLFYLGLEFSVGRLITAGRSITKGGLIYMVINFPLGLLFGWLMGWPVKETLLAAGVITISSSAIVAKVLVDLKRTAHAETEMILGIMMFQDVFVAVYLSLLSGLILSGASSFGGITASVMLALGFMAGALVLGRRAIPWLNRALNIPSDEIFLLVVFSGVVLVAGLSEVFHIAEAIGALLVGLILAETEHAHRIGRLVITFRDFFGAMFFFHFGLTIDPLGLGGAVWPALGAVALTLVANFVAGMLAGRSVGLSHKASSYIGVTIVSRGEFSIILANLAKAGGLMPILQPFSALYVLTMAITGPLLTKEARHVFKALNKVFGWQKIKPTAPISPPESPL